MAELGKVQKTGYPVKQYLIKSESEVKVTYLNTY